MGTRPVATRPSVRTIIIVSDLHVGCRLGLMSPRGAKLDDGGRYTQSRAQRVVWRWWSEFWDEWVPAVTQGEPFALVLNGDLLEGVHHRVTTPWSHHLGDQIAAAIDIVRPVAARAAACYLVRGTEAHAGISAVDEEHLGRGIGAVPTRDGQASHWELWLRLGPHLIHCAHHIGTTSSAQHEASAVNAELTAVYQDAARWGLEPPSVVVRSHRHRSIEVRIPTAQGLATALVTPGWQLKTPFAYRVAGARVTRPQCGGVAIRLEGRELVTRHYVRSLDRDEAITL